MPLPPPPRDESGSVTAYDEPAISQGDRVIRRISHQHIVTDTTGRLRISSLAYQESSEPNFGMSVDIEKLILEAGKEPADWVTDAEWPASVFFTAGYLRNEGLKIGSDPLPENPYHGEVWGITPGKKRKLHKAAAWFVEMPGVALC